MHKSVHFWTRRGRLVGGRFDVQLFESIHHVSLQIKMNVIRLVWCHMLHPLTAASTCHGGIARAITIPKP